MLFVGKSNSVSKCVSCFSFSGEQLGDKAPSFRFPETSSISSSPSTSSKMWCGLSDGVLSTSGPAEASTSSSGDASDSLQVVAGTSSSSSSSTNPRDCKKPGKLNVALLPYSSTSMPSISLIGSSTERSARDGRLRDNAPPRSSLEPPISSM